MRHDCVFKLSFWSFLLVLLAGLPLGAETTRLALVVGNAAYEGDAALKNPVNDATDVASALKAAGWQVTLVTDADRRGFSRAVDNWGEQLATNKESNALFYYAGHGMQVDGQNYLLPVKTPFDTLSDVKHDAINLADVSTTIEESGTQVSLIVLDACRDNPFAKVTSRSVGGGARGLTVVQNGGGAKGSAIMFSTSPGDVAQDGSGRNGVFTAAFLHHVGSDLKLEDLFKKVTTEVRLTTGDKQKPWINASIGSDFYLLSDQIRQAHAAEAARLASLQAEQQAQARQAELDRLTQQVREAESAKAAELKKQLEAAQKEASSAKAAQAAAAALASSLLSEANKPKGKVRFESSVKGTVAVGSIILGPVAPGAPLFADSLGVGQAEFRFVGEDGTRQVKSAQVGTAAYTTLFFGKIPEGGTANGLSSISITVNAQQTGTLHIQARALAGDAAVAVPALMSVLRVGDSTQSLESPVNFTGEPFELTPGVNLVTSGSWLISARLEGDVQDAWYATAVVRTGGDAAVFLPVINYSGPYQLKEAQARRTIVEKQLFGANLARLGWNALGWISVIPGAFMTMAPAGVFLFSDSSNPRTEQEKNGALNGLWLGLPLDILAILSFSVYVPDAKLKNDMAELDKIIQLYERSSVSP